MGRIHCGQCPQTTKRPSLGFAPLYPRTVPDRWSYSELDDRPQRFREGVFSEVCQLLNAMVRKKQPTRSDLLEAIYSREPPYSPK
jgi:hypothetical protein